jgi:hypothetical protein
LHLIGKIQGQTAHTIFVSFPLEHVVAVDANIFDLKDVIIVPQPEWTVASLCTNSTTGTSNGDAGAGTDDTAAMKELIARRMLGTSLQAWLPPDVYKALSQEMKTMKRDFLKRTFWFGRGHAFTLSTVNHENNGGASQGGGAYAGGTIAIEIEEQDPNEASESYVKGLQYMSRLLDFYANDTIVKMACDALFEFFPKYDRGMVYRFNDDQSGEIIHEVIRPESGLKSSYLGQSFPKYDIPQSTRELYKKNTLRFIRDATEPDVAIVSKKSLGKANSGAGAGADDVDLTQIRCRACLKPHLIYMQNMGVRCSMSLAIMVEGELWGLFSFHGYSQPFKPSLHQRISCETIASMVSVRVESLVRKSASARIVGIGETLIRWSPDRSVHHNLERLGQELVDLLDVDVLVGNALDDNNDQETITVGDKSLVPRQAFWDHMMAIQPSRHLVSAATRAEIDEMGIGEESCPARMDLSIFEKARPKSFWDVACAREMSSG